MAYKKKRRNDVEKTDIYQDITNMMLEKLESGVAPWVCEWDRKGGGLPTSFATGSRYKGINRLILMLKGDQEGHVSSTWLTFGAAKKAGGHIKKGEKGITVLKYNKLYKHNNARISEDRASTIKAAGGDVQETLIKGKVGLFNLSQTEGIDNDRNIDEVMTGHKNSDVAKKIKKIAKALGVKVVSSSDCGEAYYSVSKDFIAMPMMESFSSEDAFYSTMLHEIGHSTGAKSRIGREFGKSMSDENYCKEELVAELFSSFMSQELGIKSVLQHENYIVHYAKKLKEDNKAIIDAAGAAEKASAYVLGKLHKYDVTLKKRRDDPSLEM